jgi:hypothetical protein
MKPDKEANNHELAPNSNSALTGPCGKVQTSITLRQIQNHLLKSLCLDTPASTQDLILILLIGWH